MKKFQIGCLKLMLIHLVIVPLVSIENVGDLCGSSELRETGIQREGGLKFVLELVLKQSLQSLAKSSESCKAFICKS